MKVKVETDGYALDVPKNAAAKSWPARKIYSRVLDQSLVPYSTRGEAVREAFETKLKIKLGVKTGKLLVCILGSMFIA